jgi:Short C-terminal domain
MQPNSRRFAWIAIVVLLLLVVGGVAFGFGVVAGHGEIGAAMPMRGFAVRYPGIGLTGFLGPLILIGLAVAFVVLLVREPRQPAPPPAPPAPRDDGNGVDRLRELATMHTQGQLTDEEFAAAKRKLLGL